MNVPADNAPAADSEPGKPDGKLAPLPGERGIPNVALATQVSLSRKGLVAVALFVLTLLSFSAVSIQRWMASKNPDESPAKLASDRPAASSFEPKRPDMTPLPVRPAASASSLRVPAIVATSDELAEPIGVRRTSPPPPASSTPTPLPEDAPSVLVSSRPVTPTAAQRPAATETGEGTTAPPNDPLAQTRRNLEAYQRQLQVLLDSLAKTGAASAPVGVPPFAAPANGASTSAAPGTGALFGGQLPMSPTPRVTAATLGNRSLILPKGTAFTCALTTKVVSAASGLVGCQVQRNVFGDDGRVLLIERGSHLDGEYRVTSVKPGTVRIPVLWTRVRTPHGVIVDLDSPATGPLGESGIDGYVDNRWPERIGAALLLSLIDDAVQLALRHESSDSQGNAVVLSSTTTTGSKLDEKVLDSTINIPPLIYQNQGGVVGIYVARDVDFSSVYELRPSAEESRR
jgi:type IV secretion system protein VirB10